MSATGILLIILPITGVCIYLVFTMLKSFLSSVDDSINFFAKAIGGKIDKASFYWGFGQGGIFVNGNYHSYPISLSLYTSGATIRLESSQLPKLPMFMVSYPILEGDVTQNEDSLSVQVHAGDFKSPGSNHDLLIEKLDLLVQTANRLKTNENT